jgi:RimJ/RimL family protein N-acetyltransferase
MTFKNGVLKMIEVRRGDFESFFAVPGLVYSQDFPHVSMFKMDLKRFLSTENPLFKNENDFAFWTAFKDGKPVGRITSHVHRRSNEVYNLKRCYFGFFDAAKDLDVAKALLSKVEAFAREQACDEVVGNFNLTAMQMAGVVTKIHSNKHYTDQVFSPVYISELLKECGYEAFFPMQTHEVDIQSFNPESLLGPKQKEILKNHDFTLLELKKESLEEIIEAMRVSLNNGFSDNPMFVPLTRDEIYFQAKDMMLVIDRHISCVARYKGETVGVVVCIPNLNPFLQKTKSKLGISTIYHFIRHKLRRDSAIIIYYSVFKDYHSQGLNAVMLYKVMSALKRRAYKTMGGTWISADNKASLRQAEKLGAQVMHELHLFRKSV